MMNLFASAPTFDPAGHVAISVSDGSDLRTITRRMNRVQTLDGGSVTNDTGYTPADRTLQIATTAHAGVYDALFRLSRLYPRIIISTPDGVFTAAPERLTQSGETINWRLLVTGELT